LTSISEPDDTQVMLYTNTSSTPPLISLPTATQLPWPAGESQCESRKVTLRVGTP
jgi:hypothetical protein